MKTINTSSFWFSIKTWALPIMSKIISIGFAIAAIWFMFIILLNGGYAMVPLFADFCNKVGLDELVQKELKEGLQEPDANMIVLLSKYVIFKNAILVIIMLGARYVLLQIV